MFDMLGKLQEMQANMADSKKKLEAIAVEGQSGDGAIKVAATAGQTITNISIDPSVVDLEDLEQLEDLLMVAVNRALEAGKVKASSEMQGVAKGMLPPGFDLPGF